MYFIILFINPKMNISRQNIKLKYLQTNLEIPKISFNILQEYIVSLDYPKNVSILFIKF